MKAARHAAHEAVAIDQPYDIPILDDRNIEELRAGVEQIEDFLVGKVGFDENRFPT